MMSANTLPATSAADFNASDWLNQFEANGGQMFFDELGRPSLGFYAFRNPEEDQVRARAMIDSLSAEQLEAVAAARQDEATSFNPAMWCLEFNAAGGSVYAHEGRPWTGMPDQDDDRAVRMRNRLLPAEAAKLRSFLQRHLGIPQEV